MAMLMMCLMILYLVIEQRFLTVPWQIVFCRCRQPRVCRIPLVQSPIDLLENQKHHLLRL